MMEMELLDLNDYIQRNLPQIRTGYIEILTQYEVAEFTNQTIYSTGTVPNSYLKATGDFNNDNQTDVVLANSATDILSIRFGSNNGSFLHGIIYEIGIVSCPQYVIANHVDKDNHLDIVVVNSKGNTMSFIYGHGNESFADQFISSIGNNSHPYSIVMNAFNYDNELDFPVVFYDSSNLIILLGQENGRVSVAINDFNNDNNLGISVANNGIDKIEVLFGFGDGTFLLGNTYSTGNGSIPKAISHMVILIIMDGWIDIVITNYETDNIGVQLGFNDGNFNNMTTYSTGFEFSTIFC
ncbi:unnamed protein product [Adineta ricciae]|uniref:VCBS repeat-containing protein n=1 Tax=Adineta ricciae TaxID=249248 RepID=A0A815LLU9_ADIRI|nr:unnamed protein product [Adineta ricciae]CAF1412091.1 unnamed protein product [Adineta ricciae]